MARRGKTHVLILVVLALCAAVLVVMIVASDTEAIILFALFTLLCIVYAVPLRALLAAGPPLPGIRRPPAARAPPLA